MGLSSTLTWVQDDRAEGRLRRRKPGSCDWVRHTQGGKVYTWCTAGFVSERSKKKGSAWLRGLYSNKVFRLDPTYFGNLEIFKCWYLMMWCCFGNTRNQEMKNRVAGKRERLSVKEHVRELTHWAKYETVRNGGQMKVRKSYSKPDNSQTLYREVNSAIQSTVQNPY